MNPKKKKNMKVYPYHSCVLARVIINHNPIKIKKQRFFFKSNIRDIKMVYNNNNKKKKE